MTWMEPAMGVDSSTVSVREFYGLPESKRRDTAVSSASASTFGETLDSDSGSSESNFFELRPPPGLELPVPYSTTVTPTVAPMVPGPLPFEGSNPFALEGLRQTVMQMNLEYQRAWPEPPCTPAPAIQATNAPERPERLVPQEEPQTSTDRWHGADIERTQRQEAPQRKGRNERKKQREAREAKRSIKQNVKGTYNFTVFFNGFDPEQHSDFEMVPRLIGRQGCNMKPIYSTGAMARVWGGDGDMLQLAVSCDTEDVMEAARLCVKQLLDGISFHFRRFCCKKQIPCPELYYIK